MSLTLNEVKILTESVGKQVLTKEVFEKYFISDLSTDPEKASYRYVLKLSEPIPGEPVELRESDVETRLFTNEDKKKSGAVKQIGVAGKDLFTRLMILTVKGQINNFYVTDCNEQTTVTKTTSKTSVKKVVTLKDHYGTLPTKSSMLTPDKPHFATCLNIKDAEDFQREPHTEAFLRSFFNMMKKYIEASN